MKRFAGYVLKEKISESHRSYIYRATRDGEQNDCVLKILKTRNPSMSDIARFKHEYEIIKGLEISGIIRTRNIVFDQNLIAIELEDFTGSQLKDLIPPAGMDLTFLLEVGCKIADTLGELHRKNIVHRDIKPQNILVNSETGEVRVTDFGISEIVTHGNDEIYNPQVIEGTLLYMSPEQTGRMNRSVDYRTDLYSLGITLYEMAVGSPPFVSDDPMEIIHSHIAKQPRLPHEINTSTPQMLSQIIMKLLAKTAEHRYQNAFGLSSDLKQCLAMLREKGTVDDFEICMNDISDKFNIPQRLYGREEELNVLLNSFNKVATGGKELVLVSGSPGIGKSALIEELQKPIVEKRGYYITGKYDQFKRDVPYSAFIQSFQNLIRQILTESPEKIAKWKERILSATGTNGVIITDAIPVVEFIIGKQPPVPELGPEETQNRFLSVLKSFISCFARAEHPLAVFLDDLQWADTASLTLLERLIIDRDMKYIFIIGAYRENEITQAHHLTRLIETIRKDEIPVNMIYLGSVDLEDIKHLIIDSLKCGEETGGTLASLIHGKTDGNPFFFIQLMKSLYDSRMLDYVPGTGWTWDIDAINKIHVTENVVELMASKISAMSPETQEALKVAACIGNRFNLETLSIVFGKSIDEVLEDLSAAIKEGLIFFSGVSYRFLHDRIQEAAYSLIPASDKPVLHYRIGSFVLKNTKDEDLKEMVFYIVNHLNTGRELIKSDDEKEMLCRLNSIAGRKAKGSSAYEAAAKYFDVALSLLPEDHWNSGYTAAFTLHMELAECAHLNREFSRADKLFEVMFKNAKGQLDIGRVFNLRVMMISSTGRHKEAVKIGLEGLKNFGIKISPNPGTISIAIAAVRNKAMLRGRSAEQLESLPEISDEYSLLLMKYLINLVTTAYYFNTDLSIILSMKMFEFTLKNGLSPYSAYAFMVFGSVVGGGFGNHTLAYEMGESALRLNERFNNAELKSRLSLLFGAMCGVWILPLNETQAYIKKALGYCAENGDLNYAIFTIQAIVINMLAMGASLDEIYNEYTTHINFLMELRDPGAVNYMLSVRQFIQALHGETVARGSMDDFNFIEADHIKQMDSDDIPIVIQRHYLIRAELKFIFGDYSAAMSAIQISDKLIKYSLGQIVVLEHYFYYALICGAVWNTAGRFKKILLKNKIKSIRKKFIKWAKLNPSTSLDKLKMIEGELARISGDSARALALYGEAASSAKKYSILNCAAIANELAARHARTMGILSASAAHYSEAKYYYTLWGASEKARQIDENFTGISVPGGEISVRDSLKTSATTSSSLKSASDMLDLTSVLKASEAISGEIQLEKLLGRMIKILTENAGASRCVLLLEENGVLKIEAEGGDGKDHLLQSIPVYSIDSADENSDSSDRLPVSIINYAARTGEPVVLHDASADGMFSHDHYIQENRTKAVLCLPLYHSGRLSSVMYLENSLTAGAFTAQRVEMMKMLSAQIAVSIENARLYSNMERMVTERTAQLTKSLKEIQILKDQQDGDYFLTSLLLEPLGKNLTANSSVKIEFLVKAKKEFKFKKWERELGGDICAAYDITLRGKNYALFLNADAMGKSIQGAGGAIVLGAIFKAMVERTMGSAFLQNQSPRDWIVSALRELQSVFESFDCSMLISLVLGLIDPDEGMIYFVNSEHPFMALYRNGRAVFLEKESSTRKLGIPGLLIPDRVFAARLKPGDIIIAGSDGRDDILIGGTADARIINEDETLFLRAVEKSDAGLKEIYSEILSAGELTDDISLIKIEYNP